MADKDPKEVQKYLKDKVDGTPVGAKELVFDPKTGELIVRRPQERCLNPDAAIVDQIAEDGFFLGAGE